MLETASNCSPAVSYTHLDVYKRQILFNAITLLAGSKPFLQGYSEAGRTEQITTFILFALANSTIETMLPKTLSREIGPLFSAISLVPARITTFFG